MKSKLRQDSIYNLTLTILVMTHRKGSKTHAYSAQRSESKKYAKAERRKRNKL
jgi:hypothetical protein